MVKYSRRLHNCKGHFKGRLHDREKMVRIRQKPERFQQVLQRNSELLSVPQWVHRRLWTRQKFTVSLQKLLEPFQFLSDPYHFCSVNALLVVDRGASAREAL